MERTFRKPRVEDDTETVEVLDEGCHDLGVSPLPNVLHRGVDRQAFGRIGRGHIGEVLAGIAMFGRFTAGDVGLERQTKQIHLGARIVDVVLAVHRISNSGQQVR